MKMRRGIEGKDINGVVKNKNEDWSSVWSSLSLSLPLHSEFSEHVQILIIAPCHRRSTHTCTCDHACMHTLCDLP